MLPLLVIAGHATAGDDDVTTGPREDAYKTVETPQPRIYRNPEERREAGLGRRLTDWLKISSLFEIENAQTEQHFSNGTDVSVDDGTTYTLQFGLDVTFSETVTAEFVFEGEHDKQTRSRLDEGLISVDLEPWGVESGRLYVPFGEYYSHFVEGPLLEFGETRADALVVDYTIAETVEIAAYAFDGRADQPGKKSSFDWGINFDYTNESESIRAGAGYLSDLAESEEQLLEDYGNSFERRVPAWNAYVLIGFHLLEITAEVVKTVKPFAELEDDTDQPAAYNFELAWFPTQSMQLAVRLEGSDEFSDEPEQQRGINWTWRPGNNFFLSMDYLRGDYRQGFVQDDNDNPLQNSDTVALQIAVEF